MDRVLVCFRGPPARAQKRWCRQLRARKRVSFTTFSGRCDCVRPSVLCFFPAWRAVTCFPSRALQGKLRSSAQASGGWTVHPCLPAAVTQVRARGIIFSLCTEDPHHLVCQIENTRGLHTRSK